MSAAPRRASAPALSAPAFAGYACGMDGPKPPRQERDGESERERRIGNLLILAFVAAVVGVGVWLANAMVDYRKIDDCLAQGRRNCAPIDAR